MAQVVISTIDSTSGAITAAFKMKDEHLNRIFKAYKYLKAVNWLQEQKAIGTVLEAGDTVENLMGHFSSEDIVQDFVERLIKDMVNMTNQIEVKIAQEKFLNSVDKIQWSL